jgi:hypothetical protein
VQVEALVAYFEALVLYHRSDLRGRAQDHGDQRVLECEPDNAARINQLTKSQARAAEALLTSPSLIDSIVTDPDAMRQEAWGELKCRLPKDVAALICPLASHR